MVPILHLIPDSPSARAGIQKGDFLVGIGGVAIKSQQDYIDYVVKNGSTNVDVVIIRAGLPMTIYIPPMTENNN